MQIYLLQLIMHLSRFVRLSVRLPVIGLHKNLWTVSMKRFEWVGIRSNNSRFGDDIIYLLRLCAIK